jgi:hypothetical protein
MTHEQFVGFASGLVLGGPVWFLFFSLLLLFVWSIDGILAWLRRVDRPASPRRGRRALRESNGKR